MKMSKHKKSIKIEQLTILKGLVASYYLVRYASKQGAYVFRGGDHYIELGDLNKAICLVLGLNIDTITNSKLETSMLKALEGVS